MTSLDFGGSYAASRSRLEQYFDRTALDAWAQLTSDAPVSKVRATVRAGRDRMRNLLLSWLPADLSGRRILDAGCGTGALAVEAARRGADVVAVDVSSSLIDIARDRAAEELMHEATAGDVTFLAGDMLDPSLGVFDHVVAMDSLIHYATADIEAAAIALSKRTSGSLLFTVTPRTAPLMLMLTAGKLFPRADRAPAIAPVSVEALRRRLDAAGPMRADRCERVSGGFYTSVAVELVRR